MAESSKSTTPAVSPQPTDTTRGQGLSEVARAWIRVAFVENAALKFVALVLALTVFVLVQNEESEVYHPWVSITYTQSDGRVLTSKRVDQVQLSIRGTHRRVKRLQKSRLENVHVDLQTLSTGELRFEPEMFKLPEGVELVSIHPPSMYLEFDERDEKTIPVAVDIHGAPMRGFKLGGMETSPLEVRVSGARRVLAGLKTISTERIDLTGRRQTFKGNVKLVADEVEIIGPSDVEVTVKISEEVEAQVLKAQGVAIHSLDPEQAPANRFLVQPETVVVTMYGSVTALEAVSTDKVEVYVEVGSRELVAAGPLQLELKVAPTLSDIAYKVDPPVVTLLLAK
jgi:YbbR domain-containing protein